MPIDTRELEYIVNGPPKVEDGPDPKCPNCGYIVRGLQRSICPECGKKIDWRRVLPDEELELMFRRRTFDRMQCLVASGLLVAAAGFVIWRINNLRGALLFVVPPLIVAGVILAYRLINEDDTKNTLWFLAISALLYAGLMGVTF
ncbi:MAG: hypothetical protein AB7N71_12940 [Phycisphaerae bacterium]